MGDDALDILDDAAVACRIAAEAGQLLLDLRARLGEGVVDATGLRAEADRRSHDHITAALAEARPADIVLSEEAPPDPARLSASRVWVVDPLDGTREFGEAGRADWAVHVALVVDGVAVAGAVALPALDLTLTSHPAAVLAERAPGPPRLVVSRTRRPPAIIAAGARLGADLVELGSAGAKAMAVVRGDADVYAHTGGQYEWDSAAPVAVAAAAGCHVSRLDGSPLRYNQPDPYLPDLLICRPELADDVLAALR